jgi:hypothetical protein
MKWQDTPKYQNHSTVEINQLRSRTIGKKCLAGQCSEINHKLKGMPLKKLDSILLYRLLKLP